MLALFFRQPSAVDRAEAMLGRQDVRDARAAAVEALAETPESAPALTVRERVDMAENDFRAGPYGAGESSVDRA